MMNIPAVVGAKMTHNFMLKTRNGIVASMKGREHMKVNDRVSILWICVIRSMRIVPKMIFTVPRFLVRK